MSVATHVEKANAISIDAVCSLAIAWNLWEVNKALLQKVAETYYDVCMEAKLKYIDAVA